MTNRTHADATAPPAESALLERVVGGDRGALVEIHERYHAAIYRFVCLQVGDPDVAADLTSDVFVRFLDAISGDRPPQNTLRGWLFGVAKNVVRGHYRTAYRRPVVALEESFVGDGGDLDDRMTDDEDRVALADAMRTLTDEQQQVLALRYGAGMPILDTAATMGKTVGSIKQLQARAVAALARQMTQRTASA